MKPIMKLIHRGVLSTLLLLVGALPAQALVIDFEGHFPPNDWNTGQVQDGFYFFFSALGWGIFQDSYVGGGAPYTSNGTERLLLAGGSPGSVLMGSLDGSVFSLNALDAATMFPGFSGTIDIIGTLSGGGTVMQSIFVTDTFQSFVIDPAFTGLESVTFAESVSGDFRQTPGLSLDNIAVNEAVIPLPATAWLLLSALGALGIWHRRTA